MTTATIAESWSAICPGIADNPYLGGHWPHPKQMAFLSAHLHMPPTRIEGDRPIHECLFGGAAGPGKSDALLMACGQMVFLYPGSSSVILRRTFEELTEPGALLDRAMSWWAGIKGVRWTGKKFIFPNGSQVSFGYHANHRDDARYQSAEYQLVGFDELTYWDTDAAWMHLLSRIRRLGKRRDVPLRMLAGANPGGPGHSWVKRRFMGDHDPETGEWIAPVAHFIPAKMTDNPSLDVDAYLASLSHLHPTRRAQLRDGDWSAREPGDYYREEWFGPWLDPDKDTWASSDCIRIRWWDLAASSDEKSSATSGVRMARHIRGVRAVEDCVSFHKTTGERDAKIVEVAKRDGKSVIVGLEVEPGSGGPSQVYYLERRLKKAGFTVVYARPRAEQSKADQKHVHARTEHAKGKTGRAEPVSACLYHGHVRRGESLNRDEEDWGVDMGKPVTDQTHGIRIFAGTWTRAYLDRMEGFPNIESGSQRIIQADEADATNGAWQWLEAHPMFALPPGREREDGRPTRDPQDLHPSERDELKKRSEGRHWTP